MDDSRAGEPQIPPSAPLPVDRREAGTPDATWPRTESELLAVARAIVDGRANGSLDVTVRLIPRRAVVVPPPRILGAANAQTGRSRADSEGRKDTTGS